MDLYERTHFWRHIDGNRRVIAGQVSWRMKQEVFILTRNKEGYPFWSVMFREFCFGQQKSHLNVQIV